MRTLLLTTLILGFTLTNAPLANAAFSDVSASHRYSEAILHVQAQGVVQGYADGTYRPDQSINRAEFTKIITSANHTEEEMLELLARTTILRLSDMDADAWYGLYVQYAIASGIVGGYPDGTFRPAANINAAEAAKIIALAYDLDVTQRSVWYQGYVDALKERGAMPAEITDVSRPLSRGQMAYMVWKLSGDAPAATPGSSDDAMQTMYREYVPGVIGQGEEIILFFHAGWCPYCKKNNERLLGFDSEGTLNTPVYKVDYDTTLALRAQFGITSQDTFIRLNGEGDVIGTVSFPSESVLREFLGN